MSDEGADSSVADIEARRSAGSSRRQMTAGRRLGYAIGLPLLRALVWLLNATYRIEKVSGSDIADRIIADTGRAYVPCYWHSQHLVLSWLMRDWIRRGFKACFIVSASVDGEVPARIAGKIGAEVIRGSAANTGALVLRDAQRAMKRGVSIVTTSDGPTGPAFEFKAGTVLMARIGGAPMVPMGYAADRAWVLDTWDRFMIPKPFARVAIAIGEPIEVPRGASPDDIERLRGEMESAIQTLIQDSRAAVVDATESTSSLVISGKTGNESTLFATLLAWSRIPKRQVAEKCRCSWSAFG
jgi:lysophospholipid acyltransferase (LPLAT)-like uncharacterized protein